MERRAYGIDLGQYVHTVAILIDHPNQAAHLTFNPLEPGRYRRLGRIVHARIAS
jgi:hypothetical protein